MIIIDLETTGLDPRKHSIVSIGALEYERPENQFYVENRIWDGAEIDDAALRVNGFSRAEVTDANKASLADALQQFFDWARACPHKRLAGTNVARFDQPFLCENAHICGFPEAPNRYGQLRPHVEVLFGYHMDDVGAIVRSAYRQLKHSGTAVPARFADIGSLNAALEFAGVPREPDPHNALTGAKLAAEVIHRIEKGERLFDEFRRYAVPAYLLR